jgi:hypothetical protein
MMMHRNSWLGATVVVWVVGLVLTSDTASAQNDDVFDQQGNLVDMPFEPDIPVTRSVVETEDGELVFDTYTSLDYDELVNHYRAIFRAEAELAPGWTLAGHGFDNGANVFLFTLKYEQQSYRLEVLPDERSGGAILRLRSGARAVGYRPYLFSIDPFRGMDIGPIPYEGF